MQYHGKSMAAFPSFLLLLFTLSLSSEVLSQETTLENDDQNLSIQAMMVQACENVNDQASCLLNLRPRIPKGGHRNPYSIFQAALENTLNETTKAIETITKLSNFSTSFREQIAIEDCKELLDFSVSELEWSLREMEKIRAGFKNIHHQGNLKAWLSAALSNQDTCLEGFEGTSQRLEPVIRESLTQVTQLISNVFKLYIQLHRQLPLKPRRNTNTDVDYENKDFPKWMSEGEQELVVFSPDEMQVDAVVSIDGKGHYRSIAQAIAEAPSYSMRRYIIYVRRGVYHENIDMKKKKTNIMLVGDGIGATIVTGSRSFVQGWPTFRTPTVGKLIIHPVLFNMFLFVQFPQTIYLIIFLVYIVTNTHTHTYPLIFKSKHM